MEEDFSAELGKFSHFQQLSFQERTIFSPSRTTLQELGPEDAKEAVCGALSTPYSAALWHFIARMFV
jgi:hypothetical protein